MHSKTSVFDFFKSTYPFKEGINSLNYFDTYLWSFVHSTLVGSKPKWKNIFASELTVDNLESSLSNLNLFEMDNFILVHEAEKLSKALQTWIPENASLFSGKTYLFIFQSKPAWRKKWHENGVHIDIEAPKFWEERETLKLLIDLMQIRMNQQALSTFIERIPFSWGEYVQALQNFTDDKSVEIKSSDIEDLFKSQKLDKFHLAQLIGNKQTKQFFHNLLEQELSLDELRDVFSFMHSHLFKILNKEEIEAKAKTNKYEKQILSASQKWTKKELLQMLKRISKWELRVKSQDPFLIPELKLHSL